MNLIGSNNPLLRKDWRALNYDWLEYQQFSNASCLVCLTERQLAWLQSNVTYYAWQTRWQNLGITNEELSHEAVELELALMSCINIQTYQLEFNYNQAVESVLKAYDDAYALGGIPELNSNTPVDFYSGDGSQERLDALCTATNIYVRSYVTNWISKAQAVLGVTVFIAVALSITGIGGVIAGTVLAGLALVTQTALDAMLDENAIDDVVCCMNNELIGAIINNALFITSLDNCNFLVGSNQAIIRDIVASDLPQFNNWLSFLNSVGDSFVLAQNGIVDCPCDATDTVVVTFDAFGYPNWLISTGNLSIAVGNPLPSAFATKNIPINTWQVIVDIDLLSDRTVQNVNMDWFRPSSSGGNTAILIQYFDSANNLLTTNTLITTAKGSWMNYVSPASGVANCRRVRCIQAITTNAVETLYIDNLSVTYDV